MATDKKPARQPRQQNAAVMRELSEIGERLDGLRGDVYRLEKRIDVVRDEQQKGAGAAQRMLLRQEGLAVAINRVEDLIRRG